MYAFVLMGIEVGSYFAVQLLSNWIVTISGAYYTCYLKGSSTETIANVINITTAFGFSLVVTNLLCHRYLFEKIVVIAKL